MNVLIACEESQAVCKEFRALGHNAYSCDLLPCSGGRPEWHFQGDVKQLLFGYNAQTAKYPQEWDLVIAFPPCTHLASSGAAWFEGKRRDGRQQAGIEFFMMFAEYDCEKIAIENPVGIMSTAYRTPDQIIQPYYFGDPYQKTTCLWLKGLPPLIHYQYDEFWHKQTWVKPGEMVEFASGCRMPKWYADAWSMPPAERAKLRSKTFPGIAAAMAEQWGGCRDT